ncbi:MAG: Fic family protein [Akkermansiaceae bacterium]|nr:Fic family protein [Akkermansiaceae bacterium]NNM30961.1 Fic family protein [Akkermansiaceae bacterium]
MPYNWEQPDWPKFRYDLVPVQDDLLAFAERAGQVNGVLRSLPEEARTRAVIDVMIAEAVKTSEIEGEMVSRADVASSIRNHLGLNRPAAAVTDPASRGVAELMTQVRETWQEEVSAEGLLAWHRMLMQGARAVAVGRWRRHAEPMRVVSGSAARPTVHFEAPPSSRIPAEMAGFVAWFNASRETVRQPPVRAALVHLYFESIHPFEDGNGRIGRALAEKTLSQGLGRPVLLSLSHRIEAGKKAYYEALQEAQQSNEVTPWICYFTRVVLDAQIEAEALVDFVLRKTKFFDRHKESLSERQLKVIRRMLNEGPDGFEGGINARKYVGLTGVSKATATRDLQDLVVKDVLVPIGGGRSTRYELKL